MNNNELCRKMFSSLVKDDIYKGNYIVLNDGYYVTNFIADSDDDAIQIFNNNKLDDFINGNYTV